MANDKVVNLVSDDQIADALDRLVKNGKSLNFGGGSGTSGGMEARVAKLEAQVENIGKDIADLKSDLRTIKGEARTDFRTLFGAIIVATLGLAGLMAKGFHWI